MFIFIRNVAKRWMIQKSHFQEERRDEAYHLSPTFSQNISPGQIPVTPAKVNAITGT